jgi:acetylornithine deacetylase/succinyl-diaminopimelate desuccinylase-like protein
VTETFNYLHANRRRFLDDLNDFVRFPSVSAQPKHARDVARCAEWLAMHLRQCGLAKVRVIATRRHPLVYAEWRQRPDAPTLLIYGHYDVQPPEPLEKWKSPPFTPTVRGRDLYARGACDDKGQMFTHVKAMEACLRTTGALPLNVKCLFEGEEEIGSPNLIPFVERNRRALAADMALISDTQILAPDRPALNYAERGSLALEMEVRGPGRDLHSGNFGGAVHNPIQALCEIVATLHDANGRIAIPGIYDRVREAGAGERDYLSRTGPDDARMLANAKSREAWGESGFTAYERTTLRPALTVNGIKGGYQGPGGKGVIPSSASAKVSFRLVPDQDPAEVDRLFREHVARVTPSSVAVSIKTLASAKPVLVGRDHPAMRAAAAAYEKGFGHAPVFLRSGGTIPVVDTFQRVLGVPTVLMGFGLPDDGIHAPNEKFHIPNFYRGIATSIWFLRGAAQQSRARGGTREAAAVAG